jgi:hypothetical protein
MATTSDDFLEPVFRFKPRIAGRRGHGGAHRISSFRSTISAFVKGRNASHSTGGGKTSYDVGQGRQNSRRCVVKSHYLPMQGGWRDAACLHLAYLERDGVERDGSPGRLYGPEETFDKAQFAEPLKDEKRQFRFIVSPEDGRDVNLRVFARELMAQMEADLGRPLIWTAVNHHNTDHPHVHIVVRGVDRAGKQVRIPSRYVRHDMRARGDQIMTRELGVRTELDIARQRSNEIDQERLTAIDHQLAPLVSADGRIRASRETCIVATRGRPQPLAPNIRSTFSAPVPFNADGTYRHSAKPEAFYDLVEKLAAGPYAALFARRRRPGWLCLGDQVPA